MNESQRAMVASKIANMRQGERTDIEPCQNFDKVSQSEAVTQPKAAEMLNIMNLRNRIKKLEHSVIDDSTVCACYPQKVTEIQIQDLSEDAPLDSQPVLRSNPLPDVCPNCRKPIEKQKIILQLCDQTTKDRFPDEWKANKNK